jgi:hypothetical protein
LSIISNPPGTNPLTAIENRALLDSRQGTSNDIEEDYETHRRLLVRIPPSAVPKAQLARMFTSATPSVNRQALNEMPVLRKNSIKY